MKRILPSSVRVNLVLVVLLGILPVLFVVLFSGLERRNDEMKHAERTTMRLAEYFAYTQENEIRRIQEVLGNLAASEPVRAMDVEACNELFRSYLAANPNCANFALIAPDGEALASALNFKQQNLSERKEIIDVLHTGQFAVGEYSIGKVSKVQILPVALPVLDEQERIIGIVLASLRLADFSHLFDLAMMPEGSFVGLVDHKGVRLYYHPTKETNPLGGRIAYSSWQELQKIDRQGLYTTVGSDGVARVFAVRRLDSGPGATPYLNIFVGIPRDQVLAAADLVTMRYLGWLFLSLLLSSFFAWFVGKYGLVDRLNRLVALAQRLGAGDMTARSGFTGAEGALGRLESSLDAMAASLERDRVMRTEMEESLRRSRNEAEKANRAKSEFLANMSHEIRTPLNGIMGMLQVMVDTELDARQQEYMAAALHSSRRLSRLLSDILDLSRIEAGKMVLVTEPVRMAQTVAEACDLFAHEASSKGLTLECSVDANTPEVVLGDAVRLQQLIINLVGNALKFTSRGGVTVHACPLLTGQPGRVRLLFTVADTGIGISEEGLERIFAPFTQVSTGYARSYQGAGLGLAICKRLVGLMGGNMSVASEPGCGTSVQFSIPFELPEPSKPLGTEDNGVDHCGPPGGLRILLVEDERINRLAVERMLSTRGFHVEVAEDGRKALDALTLSGFDLVLMDVQMPVMDGEQAVQAIRIGEAGEENRAVPVIALTAHAMTGDRERFLADGMDDYVSKPVEVDDLLAAIGRVLHGRTRHLRPPNVPD